LGALFEKMEGKEKEKGGFKRGFRDAQYISI
jgi:hypothetical protein